MQYLSIGLFILAALFGLTVLFYILKDKPTPKLAVFIHGLIAASALLILLYYTYRNPTTILITSSILFIIAALGGFTLLSFDLRGKAIPKALALIHPIIAISGLIALIVYILK
jgi:hypothetical protein